jgi:uncharacterized protein YggE
VPTDDAARVANLSATNFVIHERGGKDATIVPRGKEQAMTGTSRLVAMLGMAALIVLGVACSNGEAATDEAVQSQSPAVAAQAPQTSAPQQPVSQPAAPAPTQETATQPAAARVPIQPQTAAPPAAANVDIPRPDGGIWVTGRASVSVDPDLVLLNVGVEAIAETVAEARGQAADAMDAIVAAVKAKGLEDKDVQTLSFNIWPQYEYPEVEENGVRVRKQTLVGYTVSNTARIKIRDVDAVGTIIDEVAEAGGDYTRINGIQFSIEDPKPYMTDLREQAVEDAMAKAEHFATLTDVAVGDLLFISEVGRGVDVRDFAQDSRVMMALESAAAATSVSGGELQLSLNVQAVFAIE